MMIEFCLSAIFFDKMSISNDCIVEWVSSATLIELLAHPPWSRRHGVNAQKRILDRESVPPFPWTWTVLYWCFGISATVVDAGERISRVETNVIDWICCVQESFWCPYWAVDKAYLQGIMRKIQVRQSYQFCKFIVDLVRCHTFKFVLWQVYLCKPSKNLW